MKLVGVGLALLVSVLFIIHPSPTSVEVVRPHATPTIEPSPFGESRKTLYLDTRRIGGSCMAYESDGKSVENLRAISCEIMDNIRKGSES